MRCGECEAAGLVEPCFCSCCGRPLAATGSRTAIAATAAGTPGSHACASCGVETSIDRELCGPCEEAFQRVLTPAQAEAAPDPAAPGADNGPLDIGPAVEAAETTVSLVDEPRTPAAGDLPELPFGVYSVPSPEAMADPIGAAESADHTPLPEPRPWWEMSEPAASAVKPPVAATAEDAAAAASPASEPTPADTMPAPPPSPTAAPPVPRVADSVTTRPVDPPTPPDRHVRPCRPKVPPPVRRPGRTRQSAARLAGIAVATAAVCTVGLIGVPHLLDLTWRAPAGSGAPDWDTVTPLPDTSSLVPPIDPSAPSVVPEAPAAPPASVDTPASGAQKSTAERPATRATGPGTPKPAARIQPSKAAQAKPGPAGAAPAAEAPAELPTTVPSVAPPVAIAPEPAPTRVEEPLGQAFEVTQVDVRPQVTRQVAPRRPDNRTTADVVVVRVLVSPAGRAADVRVVRGAKGLPAYDAAAVEAVRRWSFSPAQRRSRPVSCWVHVGVPFAAEEGE